MSTDSNGNEPTNRLDGNREAVKLSPARRVERHLWKSVVTGFIVLLPLMVTLLIFWLLIGYVDAFFRPLFFIEGEPYDVFGIGLVITLILLYFAGLLVPSRLGRMLVRWENAALSRIPVIKSIYVVVKQAADTLSAPSEHFSRVVFLEWPRAGMMALGFVTGHCHMPGEERSLVVVYIPTAPNPTSGNMAFMLEKDLISTNMTVEEAMRIVFSGGIVLPEVMQIGPQAPLPPGPDGDSWSSVHH